MHEGWIFMMELTLECAGGLVLEVLTQRYVDVEGF
jgi:hypothetical protein